jgi:hypothetical protein
VKHKKKKSHHQQESLSKAAKGTPMISCFFKEVGKRLPRIPSKTVGVPPGSPRGGETYPKKLTFHQTSIAAFLNWNNEDKEGIG